MELNPFIAWVQANWHWISLALFLLVGLGIQVARGHGKDLAQLALLTLYSQAQAGLDSVTKEQVSEVSGLLYDTAPGTVWVVPWKVFVSREAVQEFAWDRYQALHAFLDSQVGAELLADVSALVRAG